MLYSFQSALSPVSFYWPVRSLWPEVKPLLQPQDLLQRSLQELCSSLQLMDKLQHDILKESRPFQSTVAVQPVSYQLDKEGEHFKLSLDTRGFSPEELSVRQVGRKLRVSGKTEKKQEDGKGSYSYRLQEFRQELDLPEGLNPEAITCCLAPDGKLHIQAATAPCAEEAERELTIKRSQEEETQQSSALGPVSFYWPVRSLWPEVRPLLQQQDLLQRSLQELCSSLQLMDKLQHDILEESRPFQSSVAVQPVSYQLDKEGEHFKLSLDTRGFSPEELSVRQVGRKLRVSGKTEKKQEDGKGSYSYRLQEFRQEFDLPEGLNPEAVTCCLAPDGKLHIQAATAPSAEEAERELTIKRSHEEETQQSSVTRKSIEEYALIKDAPILKTRTSGSEELQVYPLWKFFNWQQQPNVFNDLMGLICIEWRGHQAGGARDKASKIRNVNHHGSADEPPQKILT
ncbi:hypothetical protein INR49_023334 [Caranx melampygus]|nr:hypothetical protein INR49_023334 [Caranx melampygus]